MAKPRWKRNETPPLTGRGRCSACGAEARHDRLGTLVIIHAEGCDG